MARKIEGIEDQEQENADVSVVPELKKIEDWENELGTRKYVFAGAKLHNNWADGKSLSQKDYEDGIIKFLGAPAGGK